MAGAKNSMIIMPDVVMDKAGYNTVASACGNAGERCLARSVLVAVGEVADPLVAALQEKARTVKIRPGREEESELTPVLRDSHREMVRQFVDVGEEKNAEVVLDGREPPLEEGFSWDPRSSTA